MGNRLKKNSSGHLLKNVYGRLIYECGSSSSSSFGLSSSSSSSSSSEGYSSSSSTEQHELYKPCIDSSSSSSFGISSSSSSFGFSSESSSSEGNHGYDPCDSSSSSSGGYSDSSSGGYSDSSSGGYSESSSGGYSESSQSESSESSGGYSESSSTSGGALAECNCDAPPYTPVINVTISWVGGGTKNFLGCAWFNGETKEVCPDFYECDNTGSTQRERWNIGTGASYVYLHMASYTSQQFAKVAVRYATTYFFQATPKNWSPSPSPYTLNLSTNSVPFSTIAFTTKNIPDQLFGQITTSNGVTIKWERNTTASSWGC